MPPESNFGRLPANARIDRASVNTPAPDLDAAHKTIADDGVLYSPLSNPASMAHGFSPPSDPVPTEQEQRGKLAEMLEVQTQLAERLADCTAAAERAERHLARCANALHVFADLDDMVAQETIAQLVSDMPRVELSDDMQERVAAREHARISHTAALRASETLARDLVEAKGRAAEAAASIDTLIARVLAFTAESVAEKHEALLSQAAAVREHLLSYDHFVAGRRIGLSKRVRAVLGNDMAAFARKHDQTAWREAAAQLRADPQARVEVAVNGQ
jgi:hypothetical protein